MKKAISILGTFLMLCIVSCEGPQGFDGPQGPPGFDGVDGEEASVFEVDNVDFDFISEANIYSTFIEFNSLANDAILVYRFDGTAEFDDGSVENLWSLIPQNFFLPEGTIQYTSSHTSQDVEIVIDANFDIIDLDTAFTLDQVFRVVIIPGQAAATAKMDISNLSTVLTTLGLSEDDVQKME